MMQCFVPSPFQRAFDQVYRWIHGLPWHRDFSKLGPETMEGLKDSLLSRRLCRKRPKSFSCGLVTSG